MKKWLIVILATLFLVGLVSCDDGQKENSDSNQKTPLPTMSALNPTPTSNLGSKQTPSPSASMTPVPTLEVIKTEKYSYSFEHISYKADAENTCTVFTDYATFTAKIIDEPSSTMSKGEAVKQKEYFSESHFNDFIVVVYEFNVNSGSSTVKVTGVDLSGDTIISNVKVDRPENGTADMSRIRLLISIPKTDYSNQTTAEIVFD